MNREQARDALTGYRIKIDSSFVVPEIWGKINDFQKDAREIMDDEDIPYKTKSYDLYELRESIHQLQDVLTFLGESPRRPNN